MDIRLGALAHVWPDATWRAASSPKRGALRDQLGGLSRATLPYLDARVFAAKLKAMLADIDQEESSR